MSHSPTYDEKLARAKEFLGERWLLHPSRRVKRLAPKQKSDKKGKRNA